MRVAFIGLKGIPAKFGGVEHHVDSLSKGLAARHHRVSVYVRPWYSGTGRKNYEGVRLVAVPTLKTKHLDAAVHTFLSSIHCLFTSAEIIHYHGIGPSLFSIIPRLMGRKTVSTIHRLDWAAKKWGRAARLFLKMGEWVSLHVPHRTIVVSEGIKQYVRSVYQKDPVVIANGVPPPVFRPLRILRQKYDLREGQYILFLGRLVPEKRPDLLIQAFRALSPASEKNGRLKLVLAGGSSATDDYVRWLQKIAQGDPRVIFTGYVWGEEKAELFSHALIFVLPSNLEGLPISLLEAQSYGLCCLASDIEPHREVIQDGQDGRLFRSEDGEDLRARLAALLEHPEEIKRLGQRASRNVQKRFSWEDVIEKTITVYNEALSGRGPRF
jgi:glycosyltransferase involved in cell wall biosynthesis